MGEYRQDAGSLVSLKGSGAATSISHTSNLSPSYLIPFILGFMNFHACKSNHRHVGNRKVKAPTAICVPAPFNLDDFMLLQVQSTWEHLLLYIYIYCNLVHFRASIASFICMFFELLHQYIPRKIIIWCLVVSHNIKCMYLYITINISSSMSLFFQKRFFI